MLFKLVIVKLKHVSITKQNQNVHIYRIMVHLSQEICDDIINVKIRQQLQRAISYNFVIKTVAV